MYESRNNLQKIWKWATYLNCAILSDLSLIRTRINTINIITVLVDKYCISCTRPRFYITFRALSCSDVLVNDWPTNDKRHLGNVRQRQRSTKPKIALSLFSKVDVQNLPLSNVYRINLLNTDFSIIHIYNDNTNNLGIFLNYTINNLFCVKRQEG